ncbi:ABC-2 type transporter-domain-containing protein [Ilyonectria robusta]|uniref:ABC-2 type transporter-domain-containing protein n=1 Tax=Ilyonectria robusta TaxID=1079257 RepID=UPI001E8E0BCE|nr:ABC-2 type transporter-domain-containing protein [Ilyonectria robusta]KAH8686519.1 ABC-2 type transporter-domain-containing protein [Ilyonectria robusta]
MSTNAIERETINQNEPPSTSYSRASTQANDNGDNNPPEMQTEIEALARQLTHASAAFDTELHAFNPQPGTQLDPGSTNFDSREWVRALIKLTESDPGAAPPRSLGVAFQKLDVFGWGSGAEHQKSVLDYPLDIVSSFVDLFGGNRNKRRIDILRNFEGVVDKGELLLVLGPPGSGCSTLLKTIAGETSGLEVSSDSYMNFRGIDASHIRKTFRGDVLYNAEVDSHLAHLTVGETLSFAASAHSVRHVPGGVSREEADTMMRNVMMAIFGISHTVDTRVGDDFVRGVSGGERKRVSIAEAALTGAKLQCWDNTTRGLDSGNAINFCKNLRLQADLLGVAGAVAIYQAPQSAYDLFDRVTVLYEGRQIFFGKATEARRYFEELGFHCPDRQTTPDFLTSMTSPQERQVRAGFEATAPRTPDEFANRWQTSEQRKILLRELGDYEKNHPPQERLAEYKESRRAEQFKRQREQSPYTISYSRQVSLTIWRSWRRLLADPGFTIASLMFNVVMAVVLGSLFFNLTPDSSSFYYRGGMIFFSLLFNAFASQLEVLTVYIERPVVQKHNRYAFYHQSAQAIASYIIDLPYKTVNMFVFNLMIYFMSNLRREPGAFFFFCLTTYLTTLVMSLLYRTLACLTRTSHQAMVPAAILSLGLMIYTGFTIPTNYMLGWSRWMNYLNPLAYAFESLMANEFHAREFPCAQMIPKGPGYDSLPSASQICSVIGAEVGSSMVNGDRYINMSFNYYNSHKWRNIGILCLFLVAFFFAYIVSAEFAKPPKSKGEVLVFRKGKMPLNSESSGNIDVEAPGTRPVVAEKTGGTKGQSGLTAGASVFHWEDLCYDIQIKGKDRRILDQVDGWVKPGVSTALMGVSGAGKTTLLDVLATRVTMGVVSGDTHIDGKPTDASFQHRVGYVQQQDLHLNTMTVREALEFSAILRQSAEIPREEKLQYVEHVIDMLDMQEFSDAVIGVPGEGLNVEQRKRLTIGVELAARPQLLVFLDEPTSGLDSQTSWAICDLIEKLTASGQAVLCTIHQPSAILFQRFDRLLLLAPGGKTVYFGDLGQGSSTLLEYFERNGAPPCPPDANPAEYMLEMIQPPADGSETTNWHEVWRNSPEYQGVKKELSRLNALPVTQSADIDPMGGESSQHQEFVTSFSTQFWQVLIRTWKHFWRSPAYIWSKAILIVISSLYLGFSFSANNSIQGLQNQLYAIFMYLVLFGNINEQIMPMFVPQRALYEVRERPSKIYRWNTFILANILVEMAWNTLMAAIMYFCWYYPVGFVQNTTSDDQQIRGFLIFLFLLMFMLFTSTFSHFSITWIETAEEAGVLATLLWMLCIAFCGVGVPPSDIPGFWHFMYRTSPGTYLIGGIMSTAVYGSEVKCADNEILSMAPPANMTCSEFLGPFVEYAGGRLLNPSSTEACNYCALNSTEEFLSRFDISYDDRWRDFGLLWVYVLANIAGALALYWVFRVPKGKGVKRN